MHHDDAEREYAYDGGRRGGGAATGREAEGWIVVSMKDDWKTVFAGD